MSCEQSDVDALSDIDETGKCILDDIYNQPDPRPYFSTLRQLKYFIPQRAKPTFLKVLDAYRKSKGTSNPKLVDLGCSYGINAALLKYGFDMGELYDLYDTIEAENMNRRELIERDRKIFNDDNAKNPIEVVGVDVASKAAAYAENTAIVDDAIVADFETQSLNAQHHQVLDDADLIISTGCIGYISEKTIEKVVDASDDHEPWMAHFVLRMFSFEPIKEALAEKGYVTARGTQPVPQREFASDLEREQVLDRLVDMGVDPSGFETEGSFYADLFVSRPLADTRLVPSSVLIST